MPLSQPSRTTTTQAHHKLFLSRHERVICSYCPLLIDIPDDTYIPVDWEPNYNALTPIPQNIELLSQHIIEKYQSVRKDYNYLNKISLNGYNFYKSNFTMDLMIKNTFNLLLKSNII